MNPDQLWQVGHHSSDNLTFTELQSSSSSSSSPAAPAVCLGQNVTFKDKRKYEEGERVSHAAKEYSSAGSEQSTPFVSSYVG